MSCDCRKCKKDEKWILSFFFFSFTPANSFIPKLCVVGDRWGWWWNKIKHLLIPLHGFCCLMSYYSFTTWFQVHSKVAVIVAKYKNDYQVINVLYFVLSCICAMYAPSNLESILSRNQAACPRKWEGSAHLLFPFPKYIFCFLTNHCWCCMREIYTGTYRIEGLESKRIILFSACAHHYSAIPSQTSNQP